MPCSRNSWRWLEWRTRPIDWSRDTRWRSTISLRFRRSDGARTDYLLSAGFALAVPLLQDADREGNGAGHRRATFRRAGWRDELHRNYREAYGGQHAVALDGFSNQ